ncbi:histidine phosphatase family protein [Cohnella ginsengisoli]|uniref:Histidine phosphatase family protein n=1 Tax=Cohnella ginsengisoli TaxID=425004 RepID=A0A9X4KQR2_9BACL|nr:histidine phosphatase family protein [Cohnella ginsengisoli]MDG0793935.1 histidine phosphatase family protein [Cohnella ginsengisoli]
MTYPTKPIIHSAQLASHHFQQADLFGHLKLAAASHPALFHHYASQQSLNKAIAHRYAIVSLETGAAYQTDFSMQNDGRHARSFQRALLNSLREGGYIFYSRHGEATEGTDQANLSFQDCTTQRNLSALGRMQAVLYGDAFQKLRIPVAAPIQASPFCRAIETAALAFKTGNIKVDPLGYDIYRLSGNLDQMEQARILNNLNEELEEQPPKGSNKVMIFHSFPAGVGLGPISDMGTVVVRPRGRGKGFDVVARLSLEELNSLGDTIRPLCCSQN